MATTMIEAKGRAKDAMSKDKKGKGKAKGKSARLDKKKKKKPYDGLTAATADRHELYEKSVQEPEAEIDLIEKVWREQHTRPCRAIREDFAGTAVVCGEWVKRHPENTAIAVDLDTEVQGWGRTKLEARCTPEELERITILNEDVRTVSPGLVDSVLAMNFSYYLFKTRADMLAYFKNAYAGLKDDGLFLLDGYGGSEAFSEIEEPRECDGFTYVWEQHSYNPINGWAQNYIHFEFPDGTRMERAFEYGWRVWTLPEIRELLAEAGFKSSVVYWEGADEDGEGNGEFEVTEEGDACEGWIAYIVAKK